MEIATKIAKAAQSLELAPVNYLVSQGVPKSAAISLCIKALMDRGLDVADAIDAVLGKGTFRGISDAVWEINNAKGSPAALGLDL